MTNAKQPFDYQAVPGDYQYRALRQGPAMQRFWHAGKLVVLDEMLQEFIHPESVVLEIGCGSGNLLHHAGRKGSSLIALDISRQALVFVNDLLQREHVGRHLCLQGEGENLPLNGQQVDVVILSEVIEHLVDPLPLLKEVRRILRPGGVLFLTTPNYHSHWVVLEMSIDIMGKAPKMAGEQHVSRFAPQSLSQKICEAGLKPVRASSFYFLSSFLSIFSMPLANRLLRWEIRHNVFPGMLMAVISK